MAKLTPGFIKGLKSTDKHRRFSDGDGLSLVVGRTALRLGRSALSRMVGRQTGASALTRT